MRQLYLLELDGRLAGRFFDFTGGGAKADVVSVDSGQISHKHLGAVTFQDIAINCGTGMSRTFYDWVGSAFRGSPKRQTGAVITLDEKSKPNSRLDFNDALVTSLVLPKLNRSANENAFMTVTITPERTSYKPSSGPQNLGVYTSALPKTWNISAFRIQVDGLNTDCSHVTRISSLTMGQKVKTVAVGNSRSATVEPTVIDFSNIAIELPGSFANGFYNWNEDSVVKGNTSEKSGSIDFIAPGSSSPYFSVKLGGLGIYGMSVPKGDKKAALPVTVNLYCEEMSFAAGAGAIK